ncbi:ABC transporter ATP-binding protein [Natronospora cellulosivora (SeqCode)]
MTETVLELKELKAYYQMLKGDVKALDGINLKVKRGEILGIAGESGCGKSTLAKTLINLERPLRYISGEAYLNGEEIMNLNKKEFRKRKLKNIALIPQYALDAFSPTKKVITHIKDLVQCHGVRANRKFMDKVKERLSIVNLEPSVLNRYSIELSGGMKQRIIMIISSILDPDLIIADEITSALDVTSQRFVANMLANLRDEKIIGSAMFITHDLSIMYQIADRIMVMYAGHIAEVGPASEIMHKPTHPYTKALISSLPRVGIQHKDKRLHGIEGKPPDLINIGPGCRFRFRCPYNTKKCEETPEREKINERHYVACWNHEIIGSDNNE